jgi:hypothetical protein
MANPSEHLTWWLQSPDVYVADTGTAKGRGVFARRDFSQDELVEECAVILCPVAFLTLPEGIQKVAFNWGVLAHTTDCHAVALGFGSIYNHANPANMRYLANPQHSTLQFIAVRGIRAGEELTINYNAIGGGACWHDNNWFERMNVRPVADS